MNELATSLFSTLEKKLGGQVKTIVSRVPEIVGAQTLTAEQHTALADFARSELESFVWSILGSFDNVGCCLPQTVLGYRILGEPCRWSDDDEPEALPEVDIHHEEQDYAEMWMDYLAQNR